MLSAGVDRDGADPLAPAVAASSPIPVPFKRIFVAVVGGTILMIGIALLVLPGPAFVVIPVGLAILATEFMWARRWLKRARGMVDRRKARRTTNALRVTVQRRWKRLREWAAGWWPFRRIRPRDGSGKPQDARVGDASGPKGEPPEGVNRGPV